MEKAKRILRIDELYFSAAHYLPDYEGPCANIHGHTYFVRNIRVTVEGFVDLTHIKRAVRWFDHCLLVPSRHQRHWNELHAWLVQRNSPLLKAFARYIAIEDTDISGTTVERIAEEIRRNIGRISGVKGVHFTLYEGPIAGREL